jgi:hypothetical protein
MKKANLRIDDFDELIGVIADVLRELDGKREQEFYGSEVDRATHILAALTQDYNIVRRNWLKEG